VNECKKRLVVCYGCEKVHVVTSFRFASHIKENATTIEEALKFIDRPCVTGEIGSIVEFQVGGYPLIKHQIAEIMEIRVDDEGSLVPEVKLRHVLENTNDPDISVWINYGSIIKLGTHTNPLSNTIETKEIKQCIKDCFNRFECTISEVPSGTYEFQPFYNCLTCSGNYNYSGTGCCAVCASVCHTGHKVVLEFAVGGSFCDCGAGEMTKSNRQ